MHICTFQGYVFSFRITNSRDNLKISGRLVGGWGGVGIKNEINRKDKNRAKKYYLL